MGLEAEKYGGRSFEQIKEQYEIEKALAKKLKSAGKSERRVLYSSLYDELYHRVPHHPQLQRKKSPTDIKRNIGRLIYFLKDHLAADRTYLEVGPGDCALSFAVSRRVDQVIAIDVSEEITRHLEIPDNFTLFISDGTSVPVPEGSVDIAFSNQLMEHLHPDDAFEQLENIYRSLARDGKYICITPNKLSGPSDISKYFDKTATGLHLKEYTTWELSRLFKQVGFRSIRAFIGSDRRYVAVPLWVIYPFEILLGILPYSIRLVFSRRAPIRLLLGIRLIGRK